jgi:hypothetical protein
MYSKCSSKKVAWLNSCAEQLEKYSLFQFAWHNVKTTAHVHNYEHEQVPMVTDLHMRPVMGFLCLGTEAGGVYMQTLEAEIRHPHLATG